MKKILTKIASIVLALAMILVAVPAMETKADEVTVKVHFKNTENWSNVGVYVWDSALSTFFGGWPGKDISDTEADGWYTATITGFPEEKMNIIFNDNGAGQQTIDLICDITKGTEFWVVPKDLSNGKWVCAVETSKSAAEGGSFEQFEPQYPSKPTITNSPVIDGNKVTFYYECTNADTVAVAGDMNNWSMSDWTMKKEGNVYSYTCELPAGTYAYKFVVNGYWYTDPNNTSTVDDGFGGFNSSFTVTGDTPSTPSVTSPVVEGGKVTFKYQDANATKVEVFGTMNGWESGYEMTKEGDVFTYTMELANGEYEYKFVVDGTSWINDPANSNQKNGNNVFTITGGADAPVDPDYTPTITESLVIDGNKVTFYYESPTASSVEVFGNMNAWVSGYQMTKEGNVFSVTLELEKGDYQYKFVVDGSEWINDPLNENQADGNNIFSITSDAPATDDTETPGTENDTEQNPSGDTPTKANPLSDGVIILISAIVTIVVVLGGFAIYLFIKKKKA